MDMTKRLKLVRNSTMVDVKVIIMIYNWHTCFHIFFTSLLWAFGHHFNDLGNFNSFMSMSECENSCKDGGSSRAMCLLPRWEQCSENKDLHILCRAPGPCQDRIPKWYFDNFEKRCMPFYYGGCEGIRKHLVEGLIRFCFQEMGTSTTAKRSARRLVPKNSSRLTFANCPKRLGLALTWSSGTTLTSRWEPARDSSLVDVKVNIGFFILYSSALT